jgi:hypothetical protein
VMSAARKNKFWSQVLDCWVSDFELRIEMVKIQNPKSKF